MKYLTQGGTMQDSEMHAGARVRDSQQNAGVRGALGVVLGRQEHAERWMVRLDGDQFRDSEPREVARYASQLTLVRPAWQDPPRFEPGQVAPSPNVGYFVKSRSSGGWWLVNDEGCECPASSARCWHVQQVEAHVRALNEKHKRPVAPPNVSALVD